MIRKSSPDFYQRFYLKYSLRRLSKIPNERLSITDRFAKILHEICTTCNRHSSLSQFAELNGYDVVEELGIPDFGKQIDYHYSLKIPNIIKTSTNEPQQSGNIILTHRQSGRIRLQLPVITDRNYLIEKLQELENHFEWLTAPRV